MWQLFIIFCVLISTTLQAEVKVLAFAGSTQENSFNKKLVNEAAALAKEQGAIVTIIDLKNYAIPFYDSDLEMKEKMPVKAKELRQLLIANDVIFIASPEYNGSLSGVLKNAIDWASRSEEGSSSRDAFKGKRFFIMSTSPGASGGVRGLTHLRSIIENIGGTVLAQQFLLPQSFNAFDEQGHLKDKDQQELLKQMVQSALAS